MSKVKYIYDSELEVLSTQLLKSICKYLFLFTALLLPPKMIIEFNSRPIQAIEWQYTRVMRVVAGGGGWCTRHTGEVGDNKC